MSVLNFLLLSRFRSVSVFPFNNMKIELLPWKCTGATTILEKPSDNRLLLRQALQVDLQNIVPTKICALILPYIKKNQVCLSDFYVICNVFINFSCFSLNYYMT